MTNATLDIFNQLADEERQRAAKAASDYRKLVLDIAAGKQPNVSRIQPILTAAGKTSDDLKADVLQITRRDELKASVAKRPELEREIAEIDAQRGEATKTFNAAEAAYDQAMEPLNERRDEVIRQQMEADKAADELIRTCSDPDLLRERNEIDAELGTLGGQIAKLKNDAANCSQESNRLKRVAEKEISLPAEKRRTETLAETYHADAEKYGNEARKLQRQYDSLQTRRDALRAKMMQA